MSEPREGPDGLVQALHVRRSQRATEAALKEILASPFGDRSPSLRTRQPLHPKSVIIGSGGNVNKRTRPSHTDEIDTFLATVRR